MNEVDFRRPVSSFDSFFLYDGILDGVVQFEVYQFGDIVASGKRRGICFAPMVKHAANKVRGDAGV